MLHLLLLVAHCASWFAAAEYYQFEEEVLNLWLLPRGLSLVGGPHLGSMTLFTIQSLFSIVSHTNIAFKKWYVLNVGLDKFLRYNCPLTVIVFKTTFLVCCDMLLSPVKNKIADRGIWKKGVARFSFSFSHIPLFQSRFEYACSRGSFLLRALQIYWLDKIWACDQTGNADWAYLRVGT